MRSISALSRGMLWLLTWLTAGSMWDVAALSIWSPASMTHRLASLVGDSLLIGGAYFGCALLCLPLLVALLIPAFRITRATAKLAAIGAAIAAVFWVAQVFLTFEYEGFSVVRLLYLRSALESMAYAILIGVVLNADLRHAAAAEGQETDGGDRVKLESRPMGLH